MTAGKSYSFNDTSHNSNHWLSKVSESRGMDGANMRWYLVANNRSLYIVTLTLAPDTAGANKVKKKFVSNTVENSYSVMLNSKKIDRFVD